MSERSWLLCIDWLGRPPTVNKAIRWAQNGEKARHLAEWRDAGIQAARIAKLTRVRLELITVEVQGRYPNAVLPDTDALAVAWKPVGDALVHCGVIADDGPANVLSVLLCRPVTIRGLPPALLVKVTEHGPVDGGTVLT